MARTTRDELGLAFGALTTALRTHGVDVDGWALTTWSPGDGWTRYRIESDGGSRHPLGSTYRTAAEMATAMRLAFNALSLITETVSA